MSNEATKLADRPRPCPFCGGPAKSWDDGDGEIRRCLSDN